MYFFFFFSFVVLIGHFHWFFISSLPISFISFPSPLSILLHPPSLFVGSLSIFFLFPAFSFCSSLSRSHCISPPPPSSIFVSYLYRLIFILFLQLNVVRGSGRFIPTPPYPTYLYGRVLKRDQVRWTVAFCVFTFQCSCLVVVFFVFCCCCCCFGLFSFVFVVLTH